MVLRPNLLLLIALFDAFACGSTGEGAGATGDAVQARASLAPEDVTVLAPLPAPGDVDTLAGPDEVLATGEKLLPDAIRPRVGQLVEELTADEAMKRLRVVCTRFDPCAPKPGGARDACIGEIRVVLQPLVESGGELSALDAAVHVFYDLDAATTRALADRLVAQRGSRDVVRVRETVRAIAGRGELSRVTFQRNVDVKGNTWVFGGFDVRAGEATPLAVPRVGGSEQRIVVNGAWPFGVNLAPAPTGDATLGALLDPVRLDLLFDMNPASAKARVAEGHTAALELENPTLHDAASADCASCHVAGAGRQLAEDIASARGLGALSDAQRFDAPAAAPVEHRAAAALRACGYAGKTPILSQRTLNESARAAQKMGALSR